MSHMLVYDVVDFQARSDANEVKQVAGVFTKAKADKSVFAQVGGFNVWRDFFNQLNNDLIISRQ